MDEIDELAALARMIHTRARRLYREADDLRRLTAQLLDELEEDSDTPSQEDTDDSHTARRVA